MRRKTPSLASMAAILALSGIADAAASEDREATIERARAALTARLKAAEQSGIILSRPEDGDRDPSQTATAPRPAELALDANAPKSGADAPRSRPPDDCITAATFAATRDALGADPIASIGLLHRLVQESDLNSRSEVLNQLALAYLSVGFADEAAAVLRQTPTPDDRNKMLQLIAAAGGTAMVEDAIGDMHAHCGALTALAAFAASTDRAAPADLGEEEVAALAALPHPLAMAIATRAVSRLMDLRDIAHAEQVLELMTSLAMDADGAQLALLQGRLAALRAAAADPAKIDPLAFPEELEKAALLVEHPEFVDAVDPAAAKSALALLAELGAPEAIRRSKLADRQPPATAELLLATAYARAGRYSESAGIAERHANEKAFEPIRAAIAIAGNSDDTARSDAAAPAAAWRNGDWSAAQASLSEAFSNDPSVLTAGRLAIAAALGGRRVPPPAAAAILRADGKGAALLSWFSPPPQRMTAGAVRTYAKTLATEAATMRELIEDE